MNNNASELQKKAADSELLKKAAESIKKEAAISAAPAAPLPVSAETAREALAWVEILGEPKCRSRHKRRR